MAYADVDGQRLYYEDTGGDGPPVVLSHDFLLDHEMFAAQVAHLRSVYRIITWDQRGFGATESSGDAFTLWDSARDLFALLDELEIERAVLAGVAQGGEVSLRAALLAPDRVRALVLLATGAAAEDPDVAESDRAAVGTWAEQGYRDDVALAFADRLGDAEEASRWRDRWRTWDPAQLRNAGAALLDRDDVSDRLEELAMPALLLHGTADGSVPVERGHEICAEVSDCRGVVEVAGAGRVPSLTHAEVVTPAIREFLEGLPA